MIGHMRHPRNAARSRAMQADNAFEGLAGPVTSKDAHTCVHASIHPYQVRAASAQLLGSISESTHARTRARTREHAHTQDHWCRGPQSCSVYLQVVVSLLLVVHLSPETRILICSRLCICARAFMYKHTRLLTRTSTRAHARAHTSSR